MASADKDRAEALYTRFTVSEADLELAREHATYMLEHGLHVGPTKDNKALYSRQAAFVCSLVMAYGRIFTSSNGLPHFPERLKQYSDEEKELHTKLLDMRDTQYAHADGRSHHVNTLSGGDIPAIYFMPVMWIGRHDLELFLTMSEGLLRRIRNRMSELHGQITRPV